MDVAAGQRHLLGAYETARALPVHEIVFRKPTDEETRGLKPQHVVMRCGSSHGVGRCVG